ncbi:hypothetical protein UT300018_08060 [Clostridium faecium]|uniref:Uncharacterized protein n=1 Tax=Clostridium faecium TaxID=2762223 RepID=A0ABR8YPF3_9CLOT|nr:MULTISPECIES: hypothetical protein [Clostridium]MBD8046123.1 hypothetical protein [Clostridium faecium]
MKKNKRKNLLAILLISFFLLNNSLIVYGKSNTIFSVFSTEHKFNIKLENLKNINQISFKVSADYSIKENNKKLKANSKYTIKSKKSSFDLLEEGEILLENQNTITLISNNEKDYTTLVDKPFYGSIYGNCRWNYGFSRRLTN